MYSDTITIEEKTAILSVILHFVESSGLFRVMTEKNSRLKNPTKIMNEVSFPFRRSFTASVSAIYKDQTQHNNFTGRILPFF